MKNKKKMSFNFIYNKFLAVFQEKILKRFFYSIRIKKIKKENILKKLFDCKFDIKKKKKINNILVNQRFLLTLFTLERIKVKNFLFHFQKLIIFVKYLKIFIIFTLHSKKNFLFNSYFLLTKHAVFWIFIRQLLAVANSNKIKICYHKLTRNLSRKISYFNEKNFQIKKKKNNFMTNPVNLKNIQIFPKYFNFYRFVHINVIYLIISQKKLSDYLHFNLKNSIKFNKIIIKAKEKIF
nr:winged helix-turn-helix domain-containing protein [Cryptomonas curvata]